VATTDRRQREKQRRREDILIAARDLFFQKGFRDTTIDDIARSTELARGTIYLYFENKEEIYATVLEEGLDLLYDLVTSSYDPSLDPLTNLLAGHDGFMRFHDELPEYYNVLMLHKLPIMDMLPQQVKERLNGKMAKMARWISDKLEIGIAKGVFRPMDTMNVAFLQMGIATGFAIMLDRCSMPHDDHQSSREELRQTMHDLIANGVVTRRSLS